MSIDLHIHSKNSDGTDSIDEIVSKSKDQQLQAISITDHEYLSEVNAEGIEIISGVEMSVSWNDLDSQNPYSGIHLLIYFSEKNTPLDKMLFKIRAVSYTHLTLPTKRIV